MLTPLEAKADGTDYHLRAVTQRVADRFGLNDAERAEPLSSGQQTVIANRVFSVGVCVKMRSSTTTASGAKSLRRA
jgi:restriction endonuclease Mrr